MSNIAMPVPNYHRRKDVFVINDIDLVVPPTNIHVQKEDLIWQWRALRAKASTKIPSGSGQVAVTVNIPFTGSMILDMHRLIVEFRHSPFCYIENRFLRETIVPHWAQSQFMAFTMTGLSVAPMQGSSDSWVMQLDLTWFNYQPFLHNWLYRQDWTTVPLSGDDNLTSGESYNMTIGWGWEDGVKVPRRVVLPSVPSTEVKPVREWNVVQEQFENVSQLTIEQMETLHVGEVFDLQPLPNRMRQAQFVSRPLDSRIYVRYINYLQRDALMQNFGIDCERDMGYVDNHVPPIHSAYFGGIKDGEVIRTYPLHAGIPGSDSKIARLSSRLRSRWNAEMNSLQGRATFSFASYNEVRMPEDWSKSVSSAHQHSREQATDGLMSASAEGSEFITTYSDPAEKQVEGRVRVRRGWSSPVDSNGQYRSVPVGHFHQTVPMSVADAQKTVVSKISWRSAALRNKIYKSTGKTGAMHWGTDFTLKEGSPVFAVEAGTISSIRLNDNSKYGIWKYINPDTSLLAGYSKESISDGEDFKKSMLAVDPNLTFKGLKVASNSEGRGFPVGTFVKSLKHPGWYLITANSAGNRIEMSHAGSTSSYFHLAGVSDEAMTAFGQSPRQPIPAGTLIGFVGRSGPVKGSFTKAKLEEATKKYVAGDPATHKFVSRSNNDGSWDPPGSESSQSLYHLGSHLHFEYFETNSAGTHRDTPHDDSDGVPEKWRWSKSRKVPVDITVSFEQAVQSDSEVKPSAAAKQITKAKVQEEIKSDKELDSDDKAGVVDMLDTLWRDDWLYYDRDEQITNVWWKHFHLNIEPGNMERLDESKLADDNVILSAVAGGLRHVVANIPILGHEFPTQQHLGSVEPFYSFEFCSIDGEGQGDQRLAGISKNAELLIGMRTMLHSNARNFRPITDSWAVACNSFITRLLGTHKDDDVQIAFDEEEKVVADVSLKRRLIATRGSSMSVDGHPGLSCHTLEFQETNPYEGEAITSSSPAVGKIEEARCELLKKLYAFEFQEKYQEVANAVLIATLAGADVSSGGLGKDDFGEFSLEYVTKPELAPAGSLSLYRAGDKDFIIGGQDLGWLAANSGVEGSNFGQTSIPGYPDLKGIPLSSAFPDSAITGGGDKTTRDVYGVSNDTPTKVEHITAKILNISSIVTENQASLLAADIPMGKILDYWTMVHKTLLTANMLLAEDTEQLLSGNIESEGTSIDEAYNALYCLPVVPGLFKSYQHYLKRVAEQTRDHGPNENPIDFLSFASVPKLAVAAVSQPPRGEATAQIQGSKNWLQWDGERYQVQPGVKSIIDSDSNQRILDFGRSIPRVASQHAGFVWSMVTGVDRVLKWIAAPDAKAVWENDAEGIFTSFWTENLDNVYGDIANNYMFNLPLQYLLEDRFKSYVTSSMFGDILGGINDAGGSPVFSNTTTQLKKIVASCGDFTFHPVDLMPVYSITSKAAKALLNPTDSSSDSELTDGVIPMPILKPDSNTWAWLWFEGIQDIHAPNSPWVWSSDAALEAKKLVYFKGLFAKYADDMMRDPDVLRAFGLESYSQLLKKAKLQGSPALPDMDLPFHPYYGDAFTTPADFYMWNIYDDGNAYGSNTQIALEEAMEGIVTSCYNSMKRVEGGEVYEPDRDRLVLEPALMATEAGEEKISLDTGYRSEGSDTTPTGPTASPYYPTSNTDDAVNTWLNELDVHTKAYGAKANAQAGAPAPEGTGAVEGTGAAADDDGLGAPPAGGGGGAGGIIGAAANSISNAVTISKKSDMSSLKVPNVRLSNLEGPYGEGGGVNYPRRVSQAQYQDLADQVAGLEQMFGSRSGHLNVNEIPDDIAQRTSGTRIQRQEVPTHAFDLESLKGLAKQSANDIFSQKRALKRAYPTFKLFFVEEDEFESRLLNFDDFYSYNGVTSFTVEQSRKSPADHAIITLLNVAGTLDGTKRDAVVDLDYYGEHSTTRVPDASGSTRGGDAIATNTALDQPFGSLVLRPGLNVQLRCGYSNDPDLLEVLISGRVVDVTWNSGGDRAEIMVQSFGTEMVQAIKGTAASGDGGGYSTTHQLLGAMMLEPELVHFGRWEFGQLYQIGEGQDSRLDFRDYSRDAFLGRFKHSNNMTKWFLDHPIITATLAIGGTAAISRIPGLGRLTGRLGGIGRKAFGRAGRVPWVGKWFTKLGGAAEVGALGTAGPGSRAYAKQLVKRVGTRTGGATTTASAGATRAEINAIVRASAKRSRQAQLGAARSISPEVGKKALAIRREGLKRATLAPTIQGQAAALAKADVLVQNLILKGQWMTHPLKAYQGQTVGLIEAIGWKPLKRVFGGLVTRFPLLVGGVATAGLAADAFDWMLTPIYKATLGRLKAYFQTKKVSMFLSPQDDNLFPPHPKDYMEIGESTLAADLGLWLVKTGVSALVTDDELGYQAARFFTKGAFDKRAPVDAFSFIPMSTTIWEIFHEMSLRHPGWVYGTRPYGHEFRYTMFFGVPSQRYWSRGADNQFISRANDVQKLLMNQGGDPEITKDEFKRLYGDTYEDGAVTKTLDQFHTDLLEEAQKAMVAQGHTITEDGGGFFFREAIPGHRQDEINHVLPESQQPESGAFETSSTAYETSSSDQVSAMGYPESSSYDVDHLSQSKQTYANADYLSSDIPIEDTSYFKAIANRAYTNFALKEYLLALNQRFVPFRRYHSITSEHDLVWNGLMSSENAVYNAVDITYFETDAEAGDSPVSSSLFKAHAFIPEHSLRVLPAEPSYNCRGYQMAARYGQGTLLHTMREMYRGEIITLGNPRIRPWDIAILSDSYNDMVGPVEVEQVVHQFSHETGYITEIKPSALVIANESSSWPILEAMKTMTLATKDIEDQYLGLRAGDAGWKLRTLDWVLGMGAGADKDYAEYLEARAESLRPLDPFKTGDGGSDLKELEKIEEELNITGRKVMTGLKVGASVVAAGVAYKTAPFLMGSTSKVARVLFTGAAGGSVFTGLTARGAAMDGVGEMFGRITPSLTWLLGGPVLFLSCLKGDSMMLVPLIKNGHPIVSGLNLSDPSMMWNSYKGELGRWVNDTIEGTKDLTELWRVYGQHAWRRNNAISSAVGSESDVWDENRNLYAELTGEEK